MINIWEKLKIYGLRRFFYFAFLEIKRKIWLEWIHNSYSQQGEDLIIDKLLGFKKKGFYVDIGAYDPNRISNTKRFYLHGWRGINIEPNKKNFLKFKRARKRDINLNIGVGGSDKKITFYSFLPDTLSTFSQKETKKYQLLGYKLVKKTRIPVRKLKTILERYCSHAKIDFFSIDTEGYEEEVLRSNDWKKFRPELICIESNSQIKIEQYLNRVGYNKVFQNDINTIYET